MQTNTLEQAAALAQCYSETLRLVSAAVAGVSRMETFDLKQAAALLHLHPETLRRRTKQGTAPGRRVGRRYVFLGDDLAAYIRGDYTTGARQASAMKEEKCRFLSTKIAPAGTLISSRQVASELDALLGPKINKQRRSITTA
ncbi:helix-turn-helix domain-containing protein [Chitinimonas arctica]|uniref:Helix-turn-helix domain-containing protein n=1 Tax=Chitinimonas arctica TaxID=2594795 RepID=A0A516SJ83_9NEIS|nr:helix-turn-helix domain-containing protein [Chitinimonas arctica]QDQ28211.1 helix-turn-helix domain-containing protein [Chitinimonas arctica]